MSLTKAINRHLLDRTVKKFAMLVTTGGGALIANATARRFGFNLRGWALYTFIKTVMPDLGHPDAQRRAIEQDRAAGPKRPTARVLKRLDFSESVENGIMVFRARRKGTGPHRLKLLYLHGGGYVLDFQAIQWKLVVGILDRVDAEVVAPIYPLGPEASWRDTMSALEEHYLALAGAIGPENIIAFGDSAGGGLTLLLAQLLRDKGLPQPRALLLFSPWLDLSGSGADQPALERRDPTLSLSLLHDLAPMWAKDVPVDDPRVSALFAGQQNLPPTMVFSGDRDILHSDALRLKAINPKVDHRSYPEMVHVWPGTPLREARKALDEAAAFVKKYAQLT